MLRAVRPALFGVLIAGPFVLAFFSGGYFDEPRLWAGLAACALVIAAAVVARRPLPAARSGRAALLGLALLAAWTGASISWAPLSADAVADFDRLLMYLAAFTAALALLETRALVRAIEPLLLAGSTVVLLYGLSERLLPGVVTLTRDTSSLGRLSQPLTYWNAMGTMAALGLVLAARVAGDATRPRWMRAAAAATAAPLGLGLVLTFSRGAYAAAVVGLLLLGALARERRQLASIAIVVAAAVVPGLAGDASGWVRALEGSASAGERSGAIVLGLLVVSAAAAALTQLWLARRDPAHAEYAPRPLGAGAGRLLGIGLAAAALGAFALAAIASEKRPANTTSGATAQRLASVESARYDYWRVALKMFADDPIRGSGSGGFAAVWLRERSVDEAAHDAHSLYVETAGELGLVGLVALALFIGGIAAAAARAYASDPPAATGLAAALTVWLVHAGLDWLWEMPAISLQALLLAAALIRTGERQPAQPPDTGGEIARTRRSAAAAAAGS